MDQNLIEKVIIEGHAIANKIKNAGNIYDADNLHEEIEQYSDFVDENFGTPSNLDDEKECSLSMSLYVALDWRRKTLLPENKNNPATEKLANNYMEKFIEELESKSFIPYKYNNKNRPYGAYCDDSQQKSSARAIK